MNGKTKQLKEGHGMLRIPAWDWRADPLVAIPIYRRIRRKPPGPHPFSLYPSHGKAAWKIDPGYPPCFQSKT